MNKKKYLPRFIAIFLVLMLLTLACGSVDTTSGADLDITVASPNTSIGVGDSFTLQLTLENNGTRNAVISQIKLPNNLLEGVSLVSTNPAMSQQAAESAQTPFTVDLEIAPNGRQTVAFTFTANKTGSFGGYGGVVLGSAVKSFQAGVVIGGQAQTAWTPAPVVYQTPESLGPIPYQAVVQIGAIVEVEGRQMEGWTGSGTILTQDGLILTNAHVVMSDRFYTVKDLVVYLTVAQDAPPVKTFYASVVQLDARLDLAVIKVRSDINGNPIAPGSINLPAVPIGDSDVLKLGDPIVIIGYPGIGGETVTLTKGEVSGFTSEQSYGNRAFIKTSATIAGGNSGGLAANEKGELIGVPTQVGSGDITDSIVDCRPLADTNRDGRIDNNDTCVPTGGFINALRPVKLAMGMIQAAMSGEVALEAGTSMGETYETDGSTIFQDDFSDPYSGWYTAQDSDGVVAYQGDELIIQVLQPNYLIWSDINYSGSSLVMSVDARVVKSVGDGDFGFICGMQDNANFTAMEISEDGYFTLFKYVDGEYYSLVNWTYSDEVAYGGPFNLVGYCGPDKLALAVNDVLLTEYYDPDFGGGYVGLVGGNYDTAGFKVAFDNFVLMNP